MAAKSKRTRRKKQIKRAMATKSKPLPTDKPRPTDFLRATRTTRPIFFLKNQILAIIDVGNSRKLILRSLGTLDPVEIGGITEPASTIHTKVAGLYLLDWFRYQDYSPPRTQFMRKDAVAMIADQESFRALRLLDGRTFSASDAVETLYNEITSPARLKRTGTKTRRR